MILVKVIYVCGLHVFFYQYVADIRQRKSENIFRAVCTSPLVFNMTVMSSSGVIVSRWDVPFGQIQPLTAVVSSTDADSTVTPFVVPPPPHIEQPCKQLQDCPTCRTPESHQPSLLCSLSASSSARTLPRKLLEFSLPSLSIDRFQPLRGNSSSPTGKALLPPPADHCLFPDLVDTDIAIRCGTFPESEYPSSLPACTTVQAVPSAGPSDASDWVGLQDIYVSAREIFDRYNARDPGGGRVTTLWTAESLMRLLRVRRSAVFRWKPGIRITASSYSALRQRKMSGVVPSPFSACRSRVDLDYCSSPLQLDDYTFVI